MNTRHNQATGLYYSNMEACDQKIVQMLPQIVGKQR